MSTTFYALKAPITSVREEVQEPNTKLSLWFRGQLAGALIVREEELSDVMMLLRGEKLFVRSASKSGPIYTWLVQKRGDYRQVIDEYGGIHDFPLVHAGYTANELDRDNPYNAWMLDSRE